MRDCFPSVVLAVAPDLTMDEASSMLPSDLRLGLYKIFVHSKAFLH